MEYANSDNLAASKYIKTKRYIQIIRKRYGLNPKSTGSFDEELIDKAELVKFLKSIQINRR